MHSSNYTGVEYAILPWPSTPRPHPPAQLLQPYDQPPWRFLKCQLTYQGDRHESVGLRDMYDIAIVQKNQDVHTDRSKGLEGRQVEHR